MTLSVQVPRRVVAILAVTVSRPCQSGIARRSRYLPARPVPRWTSTRSCRRTTRTVPARRDPQTGKAVQLTVIGVVSETAAEEMAYGIATSQETLAGTFGYRVDPTVHLFALRDGVDVEAAAQSLERAFVGNGLEADALPAVLADAVGASWTMNRIVQGFMGLGLIVGVAALGVITARSVVERRQQIGVARAIGFQRRMVQLSFLLESSFIALTAILVGTLLGLAVAWNIIADAASAPSYENLAFEVPWLNLGIIFAAVYLVALATTWAPALRASRVYPAEALRYQ